MATKFPSRPLPVPDFDSLLAQVHSLGLRLNNLFELENGLWQANVTDGQRFWEFGKSGTWQGAIAQAIARAQSEVPGPAEVDHGRAGLGQVRQVGRRANGTTMKAEDLGL
jgi:hypothetical protein